MQMFFQTILNDHLTVLKGGGTGRAAWA